MAEKIVMTMIDARAKTVTLRGAGLQFPLSFQVEAGDTLKWKLQGLPDKSTARVRFTTPGAPLLKRGNTVEGHGAVIDGGTVDAAAADGEFAYVVELLTATGSVTTLDCVWTDGTTTKKAPGLAPGRKSGGG